MTKPEIEKKVMEFLKKELPGDVDLKKTTPMGSIDEVSDMIENDKTDALVKKMLKSLGHDASATSVTIDDKTTVATLATQIADEMDDANDDMVAEARRRKRKRDKDEEELMEAADDDDEEDDEEDKPKDKGKKKDDEEDEDEDEKDDVMEAKEDDDEEDDEDDEEDKPKGKGKKKDDDEEEDEDDEEDIKESYRQKRKKEMKEKMMEDINSLFSEEDTLTEQFKEKAALIFETALNRRIDEEVSILREELEEQYNENLKEAVEAHAEQLHEELDNLTSKIDEYITYVAEEWLKENELSVEKGIRTEITENFISGLKNLFVENYVDVPEGKEDLLESLEEKTGELENQINTHLKRNMRLKKQLQEEKRKNIIFEATQDLSMADREQLTQLSESVDFEDEDEFTKKISIIKEHYFSNDKRNVITESNDMTEDERFESSTLTEDYHTEKTMTAIDLYKKAISSYNF